MRQGRLWVPPSFLFGWNRVQNGRGVYLTYIYVVPDCLQGFLLNERWTTLYFLLQLPIIGAPRIRARARTHAHTHTHSHCCTSHQCTRFSVICHPDCLLYIPAPNHACLNLHEYTLHVWQQQQQLCKLKHSTANVCSQRFFS